MGNTVVTPRSTNPTSKENGNDGGGGGGGAVGETEDENSSNSATTISSTNFNNTNTATAVATTTTTDKNFINTERQFSLGIINDAFGLGFHSWWLLGFVLSFSLFTVILAFVAGVLDNGRLPDNSEQKYQTLRNNLGYEEKNDPLAFDTMDRLTRLEGARKALAYPLILR